MTRLAGLDVTVEAVDDLHAVEAEWRALGAASGNLFSTWEWASAWLAHLAEGRRPRISIARRRDGTALAIFPLHEAQARFRRVLGLIGSGVSDELGPVCAAADREDALAVWRAALDAGHWRFDALYGGPLPQGTPSALGAPVTEVESSPVAVLEGATWESYLAARSKRLRRHIGYEERRLRREHAVRFRLGDETTLETDLDILVELHQRRWGGPGAFEAPRLAFHRAFAREAMANGWLRLWFLELDGRPAAAWHGFRFGGADLHYQSGRDPSLPSVGFVLVTHTIRESIADGMREYRFLRGDEPYKASLADRDAPVEHTVIRRGKAAWVHRLTSTVRR